MPGSYTIMWQFTQEAIEPQIIRSIRCKNERHPIGHPCRVKSFDQVLFMWSKSCELMIFREENFHSYIHLSYPFGRSDKWIIQERSQIVYRMRNLSYWPASAMLTRKLCQRLLSC